MTEHPIIVAGVPRCGTTYVARAIAGLPPGDVWPADDCGTVMKLHALNRDWDRPPWFDDALKIFLFGDPILAVISTIRCCYNPPHFRNCGYVGKDAPNIIDNDALNYTGLFNAWTSLTGVLCVRYEALERPAAREAIEEHIGRDVDWPAWRTRTTRATDMPSEILERICRTYGALARRIEQMPETYIRRVYA